MSEAAQRLLGGLAKYSFAVGLVGAGLSASLYTVDGGESAVIFDRFVGVKERTKGEGTHFLLPLIQKPIIYEIRTQAYEVKSTTGSKDLQNVTVHLRLLYRPVEENLPWIFSHYGTDYDARVLPSIGNEVLKAVVAQYDAGELITQREFVSAKVRQALKKRARDFNIELDDVAITHLAFGAEFTHAIEAKQVAQQVAEMAKFQVIRAEQEIQADITRAEGEAEAAKMIAESMKGGHGYLELRKIEAQRDIAEMLSRSRNVTYLPVSTKGGGSNLLLNVQ